jgi:PAB-dependent poly(A)-specific ribonuclease subunit 2
MGQQDVRAPRTSLGRVLTAPHRPLNLVGMPHYSAPLLSSWADSFVPTGQALAPAPAKVPVAVLAGAGMKLVGGVAYGALPKELRGRRNVAAPPKKAEARFRSGKMQRREVRGRTAGAGTEGEG